MKESKKIPIHDDKNLTVDFLKSLGFKLKEDLFFNSIRDGSGRFDGFYLFIGEHCRLVKSRKEVEQFIEDNK